MVARTPPAGRRIAIVSVVVALLGGLISATPATAVDLVDTITVSADPIDVAFSPDGARAFVTSPGLVSVVDTVTQTMTTTFPTVATPGSIAVTPDGTKILIADAAGTDVVLYDAETFAVIRSVTIGQHPRRIVVSPDSTTAYVSNYFFPSNTGDVKVVDLMSGSITRTIDVESPFDIALSPDGTTLATIFDETHAFRYIDAESGATLATTFTNIMNILEARIFFDPAGEVAYVTNPTSPTLELIEFGDLSFVTTGSPGNLGYINLDAPARGLMMSRDGNTVSILLANHSYQVIDWLSGTISSSSYIGAPGELIVTSPNGSVGYVPHPTSATVSVIGDLTRRLTGVNRYGTGIEISRDGFPGTAEVVYVATGTDFPDALAAGPAAAALNGPVILTSPAGMPAEVRAEIVRLAPDRIVVVGGPDRVPASTLADLNTIAPATRISGSNRFETSRLIALDAFGPSTAAGGASHVYVATGRNFPDALAAGAAGASLGRPVILVEGGAPTVDDATLDLFDELGVTDVTIVGGTNMVSDGIETQLAGLYTTSRLTGGNRYETANEISRDAFTGSKRAIIATGVIFPDALAASALAGEIKAPLFLAPTSCVPDYVLTELASLGVRQVTIVGGPDRLTQDVLDLVACPT